MADLAKLIVSLEAQTAKYQRGLDAANRRISRFERFQKRKLGAINSQFKKLAIGIGAALGGRALINFTRQTLSLIDAQTKAARVVGTTQKVYAGLTLAAGIAGVEAAKFEKALKRQAKVVSDANDGLATYKRAFDKLGLSTQDLLRQPLEKQFDTIAKALGNVENATQRVAIASDIWGAKNADLLNILELGEDGLQGYIDKANELGVALEKEQTDKIEQANDALLLFKTGLQGVGNQLVAQLAPAITSAATAIANWLGRVAQGIKQMTAFVRVLRNVRIEAELLTNVDLTAEIDQLRKKIAFEAGAVRNLQQQRFEVLRTGGDPSRLTARLQEQNEKVLDLNRRLDELLKERQQRLSKVDDEPAGVIDVGTSGSKKKPKIGSRAAAAIRAFENSDVGRELERNNKLFEELSQVVDATATPLEALKKRLSEIRARAEANPFIDDELVKRQVEQAVEAYQQGLDALESKNKEVSDFVAETWKQAARNSQDAFAEFFFDPFDDGLKGLLRNLVDTLRRAAAEIAASQLFQLLGSGGGGGILGGALDFVGGLFGRATGGAVFPNQAYMVGERGPELFVPSSAGRIQPGLGGNTFNLITKVEAGVDAGRLVPVLEQNNLKLKGEIVEELQRGKYQ